jgi:hypothetical protein
MLTRTPWLIPENALSQTRKIIRSARQSTKNLEISCFLTESSWIHLNKTTKSIKIQQNPVSCKILLFLYINMNSSHKNKTLATFLAAVTGGLGLHRFYLYGIKDFWAWAHLATVPITLIAFALNHNQPAFFLSVLFILSALSGFIEALVIGLTPDEKWDAKHNAQSGKQSSSGWPVVLLIVFTTAGGAIAVIAAIARIFDLLYTGGAYG